MLVLFSRFRDLFTDMANQLHQMTVTFDSVEDRILFRTNTTGGEEYRMWLTRRYVQLLFKVLNKQMGKAEKAEIKKLKSQPKDEQAPKKSPHKIDHDKPFQEYGAEFPLPQEGILVSKVTVTEHDNATVTFGLAPKQGQGVNIRMNQQIMDQMYDLLIKAVAKAEWNLSAVV
jgi:hypothetical protein